MRQLLFCLILLCACLGIAQDKRSAPGVGSDDIRVEAQALHVLYQRFFADAQAAYPELPEGLIAAQAFTASRWEHLRPAAPAEGHQHMPQAIGLMGFYDGTAGFLDTLGEAARALGVDEDLVADDARTNIMAGAALLAAYAAEEGVLDAPLEDWVPVLQRFSGLPLLPGKTGAYARDSHAYDVLLTLDRGHDDDGIVIEAVSVHFEAAFDADTLIAMKAPFVRLDPEQDVLDVPGYRVNPVDQVLEVDPEDGEQPQSADKSSDYGPALWVASPYHTSRTQSITDVTIHTTQGSYAGTISWFQNNPYSVSAHYVVRSSDGQITQMVREYRKAHHVGVHNGYTIGIEHEGYVSSSSWYTTAMYNASSALTRNICADNGIDPKKCYSGSSHSGTVVLSTSYKIKGHQHYSSQTHTDPGIYWSWSRYYNLLNPGGGGSTTTVLDNFESSEGHFNTAPTYSGSTTGISTSSTAARTSSIAHSGTYSEQIKLVDNSSSSASWAVRFLSGSGSTGSNTKLTVSGGKLGFWIYSGGTGLTAALGVDDSDGTERSTTKSIPANSWTYLEWRLDDASQWNAWYNGNGALTASQVSLDAIWFFRAQTSYNVYLYLDDVTYKR